MKKILFSIIVTCYVLAIILIMPELLQGNDPPPPPMLPSEPAQNPIDGGLAVLAAAGGAYAVKKLRDKKK